MAALLLVGCGSSSPKHEESRKEAEESIRGKPSPESAAVLKVAQQIYASQNITDAICQKVGFVPSGDVDRCILRSADGTETNASPWTIYKQGGKVVAAQPGNGSAGESKPEPTAVPEEPPHE